jgi:hypothetical protein
VGKTAQKSCMSLEPNAIEQAVARALRDNLERIQRTSEELHQSINDVVAACSSSRPTNALPPMLRAQTGAAALAASLEVLSRFITLALNPAPRTVFEERITDESGLPGPEPAPESVRPVLSVSQPTAITPVSEPAHEPVIHRSTPKPTSNLHSPAADPIPVELEVTEAALVSSDEFDINRLTSEEQELHRRANRVAKVSMQDIKMLRPDQVKLGRENKDLCIRLKDDIEKAHREYDRRFKPIMDHPVDYFYRWMVEILAEGDVSALGEYPYATAGKSH